MSRSIWLHCGNKASPLGGRYGAEGRYGGQLLVDVVGFVGQHFARFLNGLQQVQSLPTIMLLASAQHGMQRLAPGIGQQVHLRAQSTTAAAEGFVADAAFFGCPQPARRAAQR